MEIALASLAYHFTFDNYGHITEAGIALGSVAETVKYAESACKYLLGKEPKKMTDADKEKFANLVLDYANPITDFRASAWYRRQVLWNISKSIL